MRLRRYLSTLAFAAVIALGSTPAFAQSAAAGEMGSPAGPVPTQGRGIRLGEPLVLHLGFAVEFDYDTNVFYENGNTQGSFEMRLSPSFELTNRPRGANRAVQFSLSAGMTYTEFLTSDANLQRLRQFGVNAGLAVSFFSYRPYNVSVFDNFTRTTQPPYVRTSMNFDRDTNQLGMRLSLSPGGGRLTFLIGYIFGIDFFEPSVLQDFNVLSHRFDLRASWKFFPKTALYVAAAESIYQYQNHVNFNHPDSYPLQVTVGMQGLITPKLTANAWVGYGNGFYVTGPSPNTAIGGLALSWKPTLLSNGGIGYEHSFQNSLLGSYYDLDLVYITWTQLVWRFTGFVRLAYANERFAGIQATQATTPNRTDNYLTMNTRVDYPFKDWLFGSVGYDLYYNNSNGQIMLGAPVGTVPVDFLKHVVYVRLSLLY